MFQFVLLCFFCMVFPFSYFVLLCIYEIISSKVKQKKHWQCSENQVFPQSSRCVSLVFMSISFHCGICHVQIILISFHVSCVAYQRFKEKWCLEGKAVCYDYYWQVIKSLQYKFAPALIMLDPHETVDAWTSTGLNLNPRQLIPALMRYSSERRPRYAPYLIFGLSD